MLACARAGPDAGHMAIVDACIYPLTLGSTHEGCYTASIAEIPLSILEVGGRLTYDLKNLGIPAGAAVLQLKEKRR